MIKYLLTLYFGFLFLSLTSAQQTVGLFEYDSMAYDGYTLLTPFSSKKTYLINNCGHQVHSWQSNYTPGAVAYLKPNGNLIRSAHISSLEFDQGGGNGGRIEEFDWDGTLVWYVDLATDSFSQHHDFEVMPNGNILVLVWQLVSKEKAIAAGRYMNEMQEGIWQEVIWELEPKSGSGANIIWKWEVMDHVVQEMDPTKANYGNVVDAPELIDLNSPYMATGKDWLHFNSIDYNADLDQIMISCHALSEIYIIDHSANTSESSGHAGGNQNRGGDLLYRYGNPMVYQRGDASDQVSFEQHDAQWIPKGYPNAGKVLMFNNGTVRRYSSVDLFTLPVNQQGAYTLLPGKAYGPAKEQWSYTAPNKFTFFSGVMSGVHPLPNGHILVCESTKGRIFEIDYSSRKYWEYVNPITGFGTTNQGKFPIGNSVFRSYRYPGNYSAFNNKNLVDGFPLENNPLPILCDDTTSIGGEDTTKGEDSTQSARLLNLEPLISLYPNPFSNEVTIESWSGDHTLAVINSVGQVVYSGTHSGNSVAVHLDELKAGIYTFVLTDQFSLRTSRQKLIKL